MQKKTAAPGYISIIVNSPAGYLGKINLAVAPIGQVGIQEGLTHFKTLLYLR